MFMRICETCFQKNSRDYKIAFRMENVIKKFGLKVIESNLFHPILKTEREKMIYAMSLTDLAPQLIDREIIDRLSVSGLHEELCKVAKSESTMTWVRMHSVLAQKI
jgi:hypothetical protein